MSIGRCTERVSMKFSYTPITLPVQAHCWVQIVTSHLSEGRFQLGAVFAAAATVRLSDDHEVLMAVQHCPCQTAMSIAVR